MEIILQKATELGVGKITPIISERTEVKDLNIERARKIVIEATEQSNQLSSDAQSDAHWQFQNLGQTRRVATRQSRATGRDPYPMSAFSTMLGSK